MNELTIMHYLYISIIFIILLAILFRKSTIIPCLIGLFVLGLMEKGNIIGAIQTIYNAIVASGIIFWEIIVVISLVVAMSKSLSDVGADYIIMKPALKLIKNTNYAFWILGILMLIVSWFFWPSPAVAILGTILLPISLRVGLTNMGAAMVMNIFGFGMALSTDYILQGAPKISAEAAGVDVSQIINASIILFIVMAITTSIATFFVVKKIAKENKDDFAERQIENTIPRTNGISYLIAYLTIISFIVIIVFLFIYKMKGSEATALVGGTAILITLISTVLKYKFNSFEKISEHIKNGFIFGIKTFAPVLIIASIFFLGNGEIYFKVIGKSMYNISSEGILSDIGNYIAFLIPLSRYTVAIIEVIIGMLVGFGSGFSGLPLTGSLAKTFGLVAGVDIPTLAVLGQFSAIWIGGGTIVPWGLLPVAAICDVEPFELAKRNLIPVAIGLIVTTIVAIIIM